MISAAAEIQVRGCNSVSVAAEGVAAWRRGCARWAIMSHCLTLLLMCGLAVHAGSATVTVRASAWRFSALHRCTATHAESSMSDAAEQNGGGGAPGGPAPAASASSSSSAPAADSGAAGAAAGGEGGEGAEGASEPLNPNRVKVKKWNAVAFWSYGKESGRHATADEGTAELQSLFSDSPLTARLSAILRLRLTMHRYRKRHMRHVRSRACKHPPPIEHAAFADRPRDRSCWLLQPSAVVFFFPAAVAHMNSLSSLLVHVCLLPSLFAVATIS